MNPLTENFQDSFEPADPLESIYRQVPGLRPKRSPAQFQPYTDPEEVKSVMDPLLNVGIGGLQYLGDTIGKGGRVVRGLLGGDLREGLGNLIPFSDTLGITDPSKQVSGRQLLENAGILDRNEEGLDAGDVAGFATEVLTDPLTYLLGPGAALGKGGKIAKAAKILPKSRLGRITGSLASLLPEGADILPEVASNLAEAAGKQGTYLASDLATKLPSPAWTEPLGGLFGAKIPFGPGVIPDIATGPTAQKIAGGLDAFGRAIKYSPPVRALGGLFDFKRGGFFEKPEQMASEFATEAKRTSIPKSDLAAMKMADEVTDVAKAFHESFGEDIEKLLPQNTGPSQMGPFSIGDVVKAHDRQNYGRIIGFDQNGPIVHFVSHAGDEARVSLPLDQVSHAFKPGSQEAIDAAAELKSAGTRNLISQAMQLAAEVRDAGQPNIEHALGKLMPGIDVGTDLKKRVFDLTSKMIATKDASAATFKNMGGKLEYLLQNETDFGHFPGYFEIEEGAKSWDKASILKKSFDSAIARNPNIRFLDRHALNEMLGDAELLKSFSLDDATSSYKLLDQKYGDTIQRAADAATQRAVEEAAKSPGKITPLARKALNQLGWNDSAVDSMKAADAYAILKKAGVDPTRVSPEDIANGLLGWLKEKGGEGRFTEDAVKNFAKYQRGIEIATANIGGIHMMFKDSVMPLEKSGIALEKAFKAAGLGDEALPFFVSKFGQLPEGMGIAKDAVDGAKSFIEKSGKGPWLEKLMSWIDAATIPTKRQLTLPFMSFLMRNLTGGQAMNWISNEIGSFADAWAYGGELRAARRMLNNPAAAKKWIDEALAYGVFQKESLGVELGEGAGHVPNPITGRGMLENLRGAVDITKKNAFNPEQGPVLGWMSQHIPGFKQARAALTTPAEIGSKLNQQVEWMNRMPMYMFLRNHKGWSAGAAAEKVRQLQVPYEELAPFEKDVMRRLVPFYTWQRKIVPVMLQQIAERPGGVTANIVRASNIGRGQGEFVPPYVGEGMSVPVGKDTFISQFGLPTDQFSDLLAFGPSVGSTVKRTGQKLMSQMNPLVKAPIELGTGINLFAGRPFEDLHAFPTNNKFLNAVLHETPASRYLTTGRQLLDDRKDLLNKAVNLTTGIRTTTVSGGLEKEMQLQANRIHREMVRENPQVKQFIDFYVDPKVVESGTITKKTIDDMRTLKTFDKLRDDMLIEQGKRKPHKKK